MDQFKDFEQRFLMGEMIKASDMPLEELANICRRINFEWDHMQIPHGRTIHQCKQAADAILHPREPMSSIMAPPEASLWSPSGHGPAGGNRKRDAPMDGFTLQEPKRGPAAPANQIMYAPPPSPILPSPSRHRQRPTGSADTAKDQPRQGTRSRGRPPRKEAVKSSYPKLEPKPSPNPPISSARVDSGSFAIEGMHNISSQTPISRTPMGQYSQPPSTSHPAEPSPRLPHPYPTEYITSATQTAAPTIHGSSGVAHGSSAFTHGSSASQVGVPRGGQAHEAATDARRMLANDTHTSPSTTSPGRAGFRTVEPSLQPPFSGTRSVADAHGLREDLTLPPMVGQSAADLGRIMGDPGGNHDRRPSS